MGCQFVDATIREYSQQSTTLAAADMQQPTFPVLIWKFLLQVTSASTLARPRLGDCLAHWLILFTCA